jgi:hypothetical protein
VNRKEREKFFKTEIMYLLRHLPQKYIIGGDFNCALSHYDCTGDFNPCKPLEAFIKKPCPY